MRKALLLFLLICLPATGSAMWALVPLEKLVQGSDLIVVGTLRDVSEHTADHTDYGEGRIEVRDVIWGKASPGDSLLLKWQNSSAIACPRVEHEGNANVEGIWLLTRDGDAVRADYPGRFVDKSERRQVERALANSPVVLRSDKYFVETGGPMTFSVVYRNVSNSERVFPGVAFEDGRLRFGPGPRLAVKVMFDDGETHGAVRMSGRVVRDSRLAPVTVPPRGEHQVELDLRDMLAASPGEKDSYNVTFKFAGLPPTNELGFYVGEPLLLRPTTPPPSRDYSRQFAPTVERRGLTPLTRAGLTALVALLLFPFFRRLRPTLAGDRLARVLQGTQTWQT